MELVIIHGGMTSQLQIFDVFNKPFKYSLSHFGSVYCLVIVILIQLGYNETRLHGKGSYWSLLPMGSGKWYISNSMGRIEVFICVF
jgi:hypothetical protein